MIELNQQFTDVHGNVYAAAVLVVNQINANCNNTKNITPQVAGGVVTHQTQENQSGNVGFNAWLYKDQAALDAGLLPMVFKLPQSGEYFTLPLSAAEIAEKTSAELVAACEAFILDKITTEVA